MALNKIILKKVAEKTKDDQQMKKFIVNILQEENRGISWYNKLYNREISNAIKDGWKSED